MDIKVTDLIRADEAEASVRLCVEAMREAHTVGEDVRVTWISSLTHDQVGLLLGGSDEMSLPFLLARVIGEDARDYVQLYLSAVSAMAVGQKAREVGH
jgi:hypothetical protein